MSIEQVVLDECQKHYALGFSHAVKMACTKLEGLVDGDSPSWDGALTAAIRAIEELKRPTPPAEAIASLSGNSK